MRFYSFKRKLNKIDDGKAKYHFDKRPTSCLHSECVHACVRARTRAHTSGRGARVHELHRLVFDKIFERECSNSGAITAAVFVCVHTAAH